MKETGVIVMPELTEGILIKRYKRFLADVKLYSGEVITAHCANTGAMHECSEPGRKVWLSYHDKPGRKYKYSWDIIDMETSLVGVSTSVPNRLVRISLEAGLIDELSGYDVVKPEVKSGPDSRLDLALYADGRRDCFVEIKNCTLVKDRLACFPDAVTKRGLKHLVELQRLVKEGRRCVMFYLVQRMDADRFEPAHHIDPGYGAELARAEESGVEILVYDVSISTEAIKLQKKLPYCLK